MKLEFNFDSNNSEENHVGDKFLSSRISRGLSQKEISNYLNISLNDYIKIESGSSDFDISSLNFFLEKCIKSTLG